MFSVLFNFSHILIEYIIIYPPRGIYYIPQMRKLRIYLLGFHSKSGHRAKIANNFCSNSKFCTWHSLPLSLPPSFLPPTLSSLFSHSSLPPWPWVWKQAVHLVERLSVGNDAHLIIVLHNPRDSKCVNFYSQPHRAGSAQRGTEGR